MAEKSSPQRKVGCDDRKPRRHILENLYRPCKSHKRERMRSAQSGSYHTKSVANPHPIEGTHNLGSLVPRQLLDPFAPVIFHRTYQEQPGIEVIRQVIHSLHHVEQTTPIGTAADVCDCMSPAFPCNWCQRGELLRPRQIMNDEAFPIERGKSRT